MNKHPSAEELKLFLADRLSGDRAVEVLLHLEECRQCCRLLPTDNAQEIIEKILAAAGDDDDGDAEQDTNKAAEDKNDRAAR